MSWRDIVLSLLSGVDDPELRMEVSRTIYYLYQVFRSGRVREEQILADLTEVCLLVIRNTRPELTPEEQYEKAKEFAERLLESFKMGSMLSRMLGRPSF